MKLKRFEAADMYAGYSFWCAGCGMRHMVNTEEHDGKGRPVWGFNGDLERPVFTPSVLVTGRDFTPKGEADFNAWHDAGCPSPAPVFESADVRCHSFVGCNGAQPGQIVYLSDSTHALVGQVIDLPDLPEPRE